MVTQKPKAKLTYEDYAKTPEGERWELINGELINGEYGMAPSAREAHQRNQMQIGSRMFLFSDENNLGRVYSEFDVVLSDTDTVRPDLIFISEERLHIITVDNVQGAPDLVVEIRSPSTARQDWTVKRELYARHGVKEYWLVDPEAANGHSPASAGRRSADGRRRLRRKGHPDLEHPGGLHHRAGRHFSGLIRRAPRRIS